MTLRFPSPMIGLVIVLTSAAGCGSEEAFTLQLGGHELVIEGAAKARLAHTDQGLEHTLVVGDLDGDGIDDAVVRTTFKAAPSGDGKTIFGGAVYVLYGGSGVTGSIDLAQLPALVHVGAPSVSTPPSGGVAAVGDIDGDGLADFVVSIDGYIGCVDPLSPFGVDGPPIAGVWVVYGSATRLTGSHDIKDAAVLLSEPPECGRLNHAAALGDIDGDGKADFAVSKQAWSPDAYEVFIFYGRGAHWSGTVDLAATADATIREPGAAGGLGGANAYRIGDVDGDGFADFVVRLPLDASKLDSRIVRGSATRLAGTVALPDIGHTRLPGGDFCFVGDMAFAVGLGDLDGDGADDFSLVNCDRGTDRLFGPVRHRVFYGRTGGLPAQLEAADAAATLAPSDGYYPSQLIAGDVDGDGTLDLIFADENLHDTNGGVHVIKGQQRRLIGVIDPSVASNVSYIGQTQRLPRCGGDNCTLPEKLGAGISFGDLTGDHQPDLLIGANSEDYEIVPGPGAAMSHTYVLSSPVMPKP
jgi:hypothetical protein